MVNGTGLGLVSICHSTKQILSPSYSVDPLFHFGISQKIVLFEKPINTILMTFITYTIQSEALEFESYRFLFDGHSLQYFSFKILDFFIYLSRTNNMGMISTILISITLQRSTYYKPKQKQKKLQIYLELFFFTSNKGVVLN